MYIFSLCIVTVSTKCYEASVTVSHPLLGEVRRNLLLLTETETEPIPSLWIGQLLLSWQTALVTGLFTGLHRRDKCILIYYLVGCNISIIWMLNGHCALFDWSYQSFWNNLWKWVWEQQLICHASSNVPPQ